MLKLLLFFFIIVIIPRPNTQAQKPVETKKKQFQEVRGRVIDKFSRQPISGALITVDNVYPFLSAYSGDNGIFTISRVPVGRQSFSVEMKEYAQLEASNIAIATGKETFLELEITNVQQINNGQANNEQLLVSSRSFSIEEVGRFAVTLNDPNRLLMSYAGQTPIRDGDSDLNVRGNSSMSALYRLEGLDIPNPHHFAFMPVMGGGITVFSTAVLDNTDFSSGAWSADYGNSISYISDMTFRKGNLFKHEYNVQAGLVGVNLSAEGPIKKEKSSYLVNYRYSTLGILSSLLGINFIRDNVSNTFQDLSFNTNFNSKNNKTTANFFGVGGISTERWFVKDTNEWTSYFDNTHNYNGSSLGVLGLNLKHTLANNALLNVVAGLSYSHIFEYRWKPFSKNALDVVGVKDTQDYINIHSSLAVNYTKKINNSWLFETGVSAKNTYYDLNYGQKLTNLGNYDNIINAQGNTQLIQLFGQTLYTPTPKLQISGGLNTMFFTLNNTYAVEPRLSIRQKIGTKSSLGLGYGLHSATLPLGIYFVKTLDSVGNAQYPNMQLKMMQSHHSVLSYNYQLGKRSYIQIEGYFQHIFNAPLAADSSALWFIHSRLRDPQGSVAAVSKGIGRNYGINITFEKKLSQGYYLIIASSLGRARYRLLNGEWRIAPNEVSFYNTVTAGREINFKNNSSLQFNARVFAGQGTRYVAADTLASLAQRTLVDAPNTQFINPGLYFRTDIRIAYRKNFKTTSFVASLDIQNVSNHKNVRRILYDEKNNRMTELYYAGLTPVVNFQLFF